jgi:hypothetical protein
MPVIHLVSLSLTDSCPRQLSQFDSAGMAPGSHTGDCVHNDPWRGAGTSCCCCCCSGRRRLHDLRVTSSQLQRTPCKLFCCYKQCTCISCILLL